MPRKNSAPVPPPENAIGLHQKLVNFHQFDEAASFRQKAGAQFAGSAMLQASFGDALAHYGKFDEAAPFYARALTLRPDLPEARTGMAESHLRAGRLDEAQPLLDFLEKPGAAQLYSLAPLERLALAYQKKNLHEEALILFTRLLEGLPKLSDHKGFRHMVEKSEKALGRSEALLPKRKFSWRNFRSESDPSARSRARTFLILGVIVALVSLGFLIANEYIRRHRTVYLVNAHAIPAIVEITGTDLRRKTGRLESFELKEGNYHAVLSGPVKHKLDFEIQTSYFSSWFDDPVWILNIGGDAILLRREVTYNTNTPPPVQESGRNREDEIIGIAHPGGPPVFRW